MHTYKGCNSLFSTNRSLDLHTFNQALRSTNGLLCSAATSSKTNNNQNEMLVVSPLCDGVAARRGCFFLFPWAAVCQTSTRLLVLAFSK